MKSIIIAVFFFTFSLCLAQKNIDCRLIQKIVSDSILDKSINLTIINKSSKEIKILKNLDIYDYQIIDLEYYNESENKFCKIELPSKDIQYLPDYKNDFITLKKNKKHIYKISVKNIVNQIELKNQKIRFKLLFEPIGLGGCNFITSRLYNITK